MNELQVLNLYNNADDGKAEDFFKGVNSSLNVNIDYAKTECNYEWVSIMEETIRYIDNILRNPNRFIINEEDIVKVELARRVTVESIKHLSKNTNLIQDIDKKTGDVKPSKILNINKEESYNTYENRFVYSLIQNMRSYISFKKKCITSALASKDNKKMEYNASSKIGKEKIEISLTLDTKLESDGTKSQENENDVITRIEKLERQIIDLTSSELYKTIHKMHISLVTSPIKKTNVILKNTNFQYAVKLWNYMQSHMEDDTKNVKETRNDKIDGKIKNYVDETFLLNYLVLNTFSKDEKEPIEKKKITEKIVGTMLQKLMDFNNISEEDLKELIDKQYAIIKYKNVINDKEIHKKFKSSITNYLAKIEAIVLE